MFVIPELFSREICASVFIIFSVGIDTMPFLKNEMYEAGNKYTHKMYFWLGHQVPIPET